ncbi:hypothetical protein [Rugamonas sp. DEMB1]|uniref:hypothetical protein n=1 Tax=Rugamonas sp. DEMB1 TaxID=3039386 RepID=UPI00244C5C53|nr:hypothetical protein [Rugamonas sp. DEMB1]WGG48900.1 hypothetical protein QC826_19925 [Rugamonas sp. DEMB1]
MSELTEEQIAMRELRNASYHEAGHKIICSRFGGDGDILIWKNQSGNPDETAWRGQFRIRVCPQQMHDACKRAGFPAADLPENWRVLFGMAGLVAEEMLRDGANDVELIADSVSATILLGFASATDLLMMGITNIDDFELSCDEVKQAWRYLKEDWPLVQKYAEYHIAEALTG